MPAPIPPECRPHVASELRQVAAEYRRMAERWEARHDTVRAAIYRGEAVELRERADRISPADPTGDQP